MIADCYIVYGNRVGRVHGLRVGGVLGEGWSGECQGWWYNRFSWWWIGLRGAKVYVLEGGGWSVDV